MPSNTSLDTRTIISGACHPGTILAPGETAIPKHRAGPGKRFLANYNRFVDALVGAFQIAWIGNLISKSFQPNAGNWGPTSNLEIRSGICLPASATNSPGPFNYIADISLYKVFSIKQIRGRVNPKTATAACDNVVFPMTHDSTQKSFFGWWIVAFAFLTFGIAVGIPYYGMPFFYDYYEKTFGWSRKEITFGFPLAATLTLWVGPLIVHKYSPRKLLAIGTGCTALAFVGFGTMGGSLPVYYAFWVLYIVGYIFSGPIVHQVIVSQWFSKNRGKAMAVVYLGVGLFGGISQKLIAKPLVEGYGFQQALILIGGMMLICWPIALIFMRDKPSEKGQFPDGALFAPAGHKVEPKSFAFLLSQRSFWLLLIGSACSIGAIGSINQHMKFIFKEQGFTEQGILNTMSSDATLYILWSSIAGRLIMGYLADRFSKKLVMMATYFLVAGTIPLLLLVSPTQDSNLYLFAILFGFGMGADYMLIPLMAAEQFGVNSLARAMAIILPTDTIGQTWFPYGVSWLREHYGNYGVALNVVFVMAAIGAISVALLPGSKQENEVLPIQGSQRT